MGKKKTEPEKAAEESKKEEEKPEIEFPPVVKELQEIDDKYLALEREYEKELQELQKQYTKKQEPLLQKRTKMLTDQAAAESDAAKSLGTPALKGFWLKAMKNLPALEEHIEEWDEEVLEYCSDVTKTFLDEADLQKGFKLEFHFVENPFFTNDVLFKEYYSEESSPYTGEMDITEIKASVIDWKSGKNVTVESVKKKVKGGGAKKAKQKGKEKEEPRESFFRNFFRNLKQDGEIPEDVNLEEMRGLCDDDDDDEDEDGMLEYLMENDREVGESIRDQLIPFAVRWYTGEAAPEDDDDFDEDEEEEDDDDEDEDDEDDDDDDDDEDDMPAKKGGAKKKGGGAKPGKGKQEECKQQ